ncbi:DNA-binding transcriptional regulator of sugar metabolism, DeoR/GlpR family [Amycolatopsis pretoriensis]|uniref:DNA-binding transcriptional regulator of sugar metabolism, DeoR/GlpR family n=1 Tax=Amycolatopsis pretoriensis TaxID=218821 RepID=A0A1H5RFI1_9PSEU|nr:DeoR/GlpR family DNA-binding transcription regulator [Amycolatopsis pretoriensis]SEF36428.1 DNA-binding transcriptional regulator of sugar metabolism, DeoR/GlpR family [Amycolatopsis pretoriensis]
MLPQRRHELILRALRAEGPAPVGVLAERLGVSQATVRRDLVLLGREGRLTRVYGGAMAAGDEPFARVAAERADEKDAVARRAADLVADGDTVLLDIGTTAHRLARHLRDRALTVITSSLAVYEELKDADDVQLVLLGGVVRRSYHSMVGFLTEDALRQVRAGTVFLGTSGVRGDGHVMDSTVVEVPVKRAMVAAADRVVLLADAGKFPGTGLAKVCGPDALDVVVTTPGADEPTCATLREAGVEVLR